MIYIGSANNLADVGADIIKYNTPAYVRTRLYGTGIAAASENKEDAFKLLALAYTDKELANLLVYGLEGVDYILNDGVAVAPNGEPILADIKHLFTGIYEMTYPNSKEHLVVDRITDKKNFYKNEAKASPYLGFNFYDKDYFECASKIDQIVIENLNVWKSNDINS